MNRRSRSNLVALSGTLSFVGDSLVGDDDSLYVVLLLQLSQYLSDALRDGVDIKVSVWALDSEGLEEVDPYTVVARTDAATPRATNPGYRVGSKLGPFLEIGPCPRRVGTLYGKTTAGALEPPFASMLPCVAPFVLLFARRLTS